MNSTLTQNFGTAQPAFRRTAGTGDSSLRRTPRDDALDPIRGILFGTLLSVLGFWLPLALTLSR
jgi:hypothetical protein